MLGILTLKLVAATLDKSFKPIWASVPSFEKCIYMKVFSMNSKHF